MTRAIVSRCRVFAFKPLTKEDIKEVLLNALKDKERGFGDQKIELKDEALNHFILTSGGDARVSLGNLELAVLSTPTIKGKTGTITSASIASLNSTSPLARTAGMQRIKGMFFDFNGANRAISVESDAQTYFDIGLHNKQQTEDRIICIVIASVIFVGTVAWFAFMEIYLGDRTKKKKKAKNG